MPFQEFISNFENSQITANDARITLVACGGHHTIVLSATQRVFAWGNNSMGQLGLSLEEGESFNIP